MGASEESDGGLSPPGRRRGWGKEGAGTWGLLGGEEPPWAEGPVPVSTCLPRPALSPRGRSGHSR